MELHQLRYVLAVAETGSFTRAAERLFVVQSNVSAQVRKLELELGVDLFERRTHEVVLTDFGRAFLPGVRQTLNALEQARVAVDEVRGLVTGRAGIGVPGTVVSWLLPEVVRQFRVAYPGVDLWITEEASVVLAGMVVSRDLPQALVNLPTPHADLLDQEHLFEEEMVAIVPPDHPLRGVPRVPLTAFTDDSLLLPETGNPLRTLIHEACVNAGFTPSPRVEVGKKQLARELAVEGVGVGFVPERTAKADLQHQPDRIVRLESPGMVRSVGIVRHRAAVLSPGDRALGRILRDVLYQILAE